MANLTIIGLIIALIGFALVFVGFLLEFLKFFGKTAKVKTGGAVLIGPFPLVFGDKELVKYSVVLLLVLVVLTVVLIVSFGVLT